MNSLLEQGRYSRMHTVVDVCNRGNAVSARYLKVVVTTHIYQKLL